ncbi:hypothetical protein NKG94_33780 [Micromonospora sp. M12]
MAATTALEHMYDDRHGGSSEFPRPVRSPRDQPAVGGDLRSTVLPAGRPGRRGGGRPARWVAVPGSPHAAGEVLRLAATHDLTVVPRVRARRSTGCHPVQVDIMLDTGRLAGIGHQPVDALVADVVPALRCGRCRPRWSAPGSGSRWTPVTRRDPGWCARRRRGRPAAAPARQPLRPTARCALPGRRR